MVGWAQAGAASPSPLGGGGHNTHGAEPPSPGGPGGYGAGPWVPAS